MLSKKYKALLRKTAKMCLKEKWIKLHESVKQKKLITMGELIDECAFCRDANDRLIEHGCKEKMCDYCLLENLELKPNTCFYINTERNKRKVIRYIVLLLIKISKGDLFGEIDEVY